jgi:O-antigen/teichoic acid export membrane protein
MAASFLVGVQLAHMLGVGGYGYYGLALSIVTIASIPGELGISRLVTREVAASTAAGNHAQLFAVLRWGTRLATKLTLAVMLAVGAAALIILPSRPVLGACLLAAAPTIPFMTLARINGGALQGLHHIVRGQIPANLIRPALLSLALLAAHFAHVAIGPVAATVLSSLAAGIVFVCAWTWLRQRLPERVLPDRTGGRRWITASIAMALNQGLLTLQAELSILLIGAVANPAAVGRFRIATASANIAAAALMLVLHVGSPVIARLHAQGDFERLQKSVTAFAWLQLAGVALLCAPLIIAPEFLVRLVFGQSFVPAAQALRILAVGQILNGFFGVNGTLLTMCGLERRVTRAMAIALALNVVLVPLLVFTAGITGAAAALVLSTLTWNVIAWRDSERLLGIQTAALPLAAW